MYYPVTALLVDLQLPYLSPTITLRIHCVFQLPQLVIILKTFCLFSSVSLAHSHKGERQR